MPLELGQPIDFTSAVDPIMTNLASTAWWSRGGEDLPISWTFMWLALTLGAAAILALIGRNRLALSVASMLSPIAGIVAGVASVAAYKTGQPDHVCEDLTVLGFFGIAIPLTVCILALLSTHMMPAAAHVYRKLRGHPDCREHRRMRAADTI